MRIKIKKESIEYIFLAAILLSGLLTITGYGACLDQAAQQRIVFANIEEYLLHLPGDGLSLAREIEEAGIVRISLHEDLDHGMACFYPIFWVWYVNKVSPFIGSLIWQIYNFLLIFWGICSLYLLGKELFHSRRIAAFMTLLFFLTPRMFAESHYNNKDVVLCSLAFSIFYWCLRLMRETSLKSIILFAFTGALAFNCKLLGLWIFGLSGLYALLYFIATKKFNRQILMKTLLCIGLWMFFFLLMTPGLWPDIIGYFRYIISYAVDYDLWSNYILFNGRMIHKDFTGMPKKYLPVMICVTTPVLILLATAAGTFLCIYEIIKSKMKKIWTDTGYIFCILITGMVPGCYAMFAATPLYNGWRHLYFIYASMIVAAGYCCFKIWEKLRKTRKERFAEAGGMLYLAFLAVGIALNYPNEHSYFNVLAGNNVVERYELDYWDLSVKEALDTIWETDDSGQEITVGALNIFTFWGITEQLSFYPAEQRQTFIAEENWQDAAYVVINTTYAVMYNTEEYEFIQNNYELIEDFSSYGNVICEVWKK